MKWLYITILILNFSWGITLEEAVNISLRNNIEVVSSELDLKKLEQEIKEAKAGIYPVVSLSASYLKWDPDFISAFIPEEQKEYGISIQQTLFNKVVFEAIKIAKEGVKLQEEIIKDVKAEVANQTRKMYYGLLYKKEIINLREETLKYWKEKEKQVEILYKRGIVSEIDLLRTHSQRKMAEYEYKKAINDFENAKREFSAFIGKDIEDVEGKLIMEKKPEYDKENFIKNNTTYKVALKTLELYKEQRNAHASNYYPKLLAFFNYQGRNYMDFENFRLVEKFKSGYSYGVRLDWVIFDGLSTKAKIAKSEIEAIKQMERIKDLRKKLEVKVENIERELEVIESEIEAWKSQLETSEKILVSVESKYEAGISTYIDILEARKTYEEIKTRYLNAILNYNLKISDLKRLVSEANF